MSTDPTRGPQSAPTFPGKERGLVMVLQGQIHKAVVEPSIILVFSFVLRMGPKGIFENETVLWREAKHPVKLLRLGKPFSGCQRAANRSANGGINPLPAWR